MNLDERLRAALATRAERGTLRRLTRFDDPAPEQEAGLAAKPEAPADPKQQRWIDLSSNDYLSFSTTPAVRQDFMRRLREYDTKFPHRPLTGSSGSRLLDGNSALAEQVEREIATHFESEAALLFNTGFGANASLLAVLPQQGDVIIYDELVHASMHDGLRKSRARAVAFRHNDMGDLERVLREEAASLSPSDGRTVFVAAESVYSMDGDLCPLPALMRSVDRHVPRSKRCVIVDEAHGVCVYGEQGRGCTSAFGLSQAVDIRLVTFGKALGSAGAAVLCSETVKQFLINYARSLIYSTALPPTVLLSMLAALSALRTPLHTAHQQRVLRNAALLHRLLPATERSADAAPLGRGYHASLDYPSPIVPVLSPRPKVLAAFLQEKGRMIVRGITYPTVPKGQDRVRICVHADNTHEELSALARLIAAWREEQGRDGTEAFQASASTPATAAPLHLSLAGTPLSRL